MSCNHPRRRDKLGAGRSAAIVVMRTNVVAQEPAVLMAALRHRRYNEGRRRMALSRPARGRRDGRAIPNDKADRGKS